MYLVGSKISGFSTLCGMVCWDLFFFEGWLEATKQIYRTYDVSGLRILVPSSVVEQGVLDVLYFLGWCSNLIMILDRGGMRWAGVISTFNIFFPRFLNPCVDIGCYHTRLGLNNGQESILMVDWTACYILYIWILRHWAVEMDTLW